MTIDIRGGDLLLDGLTTRQRLFAAYYVETGGNGQEAARRAGYSSNSGNTVQMLLKNEDVAAEIKRIVDQVGMSAAEVLVRLTEQARNEGAAYITEDGTINMKRLVLDKKQHLIRRIKKRVSVSPKGHRNETFELELHDAQKALLMLGKVHRLFVNVREETQTHRLEVGESVRQLLDRVYNDGEMPEDIDVIDITPTEIEPIRALPAGVTKGGGPSTPPAEDE